MRRLAAVLLLVVVVGCGSSNEDRLTLRVYAAASLTDTFSELGRQFEQEHPGTEVELNFGPSSGLAAQIGSGAPADVFASAGPENMEAVVQAGRAAAPADFATNSMAIAVPAGDPGNVTDLDDLARTDVKVAVCQVRVPCGRAAVGVFAKAGLSVQPVTEETDVRSVLTKVRLGEVDAGVVYVTDVRAAGDEVEGIEIAADQNESVRYPVATLTGSKHAAAARQFVDLVLSDAGAEVFGAAGFRSP